MGLLDETCATLLAPLRLPSFSKAPLVDTSCPKARDDAISFDILDSMEKGLARELAVDFMEPLPDSSNLWKFYMERSADRREYRLHCESGEFLLYGVMSRCTRRVDIYLYDSNEKDRALFELYRPAFVLTCNNAKTEWTLFQERCDRCRNAPECHACSCCRGRKELMYVHHSNANIGDGVNHCMDVRIPAGTEFGPAEEVRFVTKMPSWNAKLECLVLDFKGRKVMASAKNFQLALEGDESERVVCQYGKIGANRLSLDFRHPLTVAQAFALSLTTASWV